jgi:AraC-like DNA-binding protein
MTNLTNIDLSTLNLKNLQTLAKEFKINNWWTKKKADLIIDLGIEKVKQEGELKAQEEAPKDEKKTKKVKAPKVEKNEDNLVTLKELAAEYHMKGTKARRLLRNETAARPFGGNRWEWDKDLHQAELEAARSILKSHTK